MNFTFRAVLDFLGVKRLLRKSCCSFINHSFKSVQNASAFFKIKS